jgi:hypothetical protein
MSRRRVSVTRHAVSVIALTLLGAFASHASAAGAAKLAERTIARSRVLVGDVIERAPGTLATVDLGPAPAAGAARVLTREEILAALPHDLDARRLDVPASVRIVRKTRTLAADEVERLAREALVRTPLPRGVSLGAVKAPVKGLTVPDGFDAVRIEVPKPPRREARLASNATLYFTESGFVIAKAQIPVDLVVSGEATTPDVKKGDRVTLVIRRGLVELRAAVVANADADVGEGLQVTVGESGRAMRARLVSANPPTAEEVL